ncbi:hypothetical protein K493DRAFT_410247 [Basidiobolus meristosporus CBS 931.73]|uniref:Ribonuclease H2 subunit B n=1 Tax=Basidiobolus meristosporus CBS 931.73 TaxID=1314790 RepID=A0A1Y1XVI6_9FUNG|nr:hypothetical protein K493DRAFT_410247 [Basidiobolus meristosporus CBS 931.73]|eukprot:ORX89767.1 hypothetical protein K493DRAFT_410247 [Basidiobolus meristosporus CBS 931.73]
MPHSAPSQWVCLANAPDKLECDPVLIQLEHPKTGKPARYLLQNGKVCEVQKIDSEGTHSWFIDNTVQQDGSLFFFTPVDPLFLLIPILEAAREEKSGSEGVFRQLDDVLGETSYRHIAELPGIMEQLKNICDYKVIIDTVQVYRLNNEKVLAWLKRKVEMILDHFSSLPGLSQQILFLDSETLTEEQRQILKRRVIVQTLSDYLNAAWQDRLMSAYNFEEIAKIENAASMSAVDSPADYIKRATPKEVVETKKPKLTQTQKKLAKVNTKGMKTMDSYFKKKP